MRTITKNAYLFDELSDEAKDNAVNKLCDINVDFDWWSYIYDDAKNIGLKLTEFDLDRNRHANGEFITSPAECAETILKEHGRNCETYKTAKEFLNDMDALMGRYEDIEDCPEDEIEDLEDEFLKSICEDYSIILEHESDYLMSSEAIIETIQANEYEFDEEGDLV